MFRFERRSAGLARIGALGATGLSLALASCATPPAPPPPAPPPPPPKVVSIPPRPMPPDGAAPTLQVPPAEANGLRDSVNRNISPAQTLWNLRSAYNVAALNCHGPGYAPILENYKVFLKANNRVLAKANRDVDAEFRKEYKRGYVAAREKYMTEVYNHFALPPTLHHFCDAVLAMSDAAKSVKPANLELFAVSSLPSVEVVFDDFYRRYDQWRIDAAKWDSQYGQRSSAIALPAAGAAAASTSGQPGG